MKTHLLSIAETLLLSAPGLHGSTVLTFDPGQAVPSSADFVAGDEVFQVCPDSWVFETTSAWQNYGDRVRDLAADGNLPNDTAESFQYDTANGATPAGMFTPNVEVIWEDFTFSMVSEAFHGYFGDLDNAVFFGGTREVTFVADPGFEVVLEKFDLAAQVGASGKPGYAAGVSWTVFADGYAVRNGTIPSVTETGHDSVFLDSKSDGSGEFPSGSALTLVFVHNNSLDGWIGWDNFQFSQVTCTPEIAVEQPAGTGLSDGGSRTFPDTAIGISAPLAFTIRNSGTGNLTGLAVTKDGPNATEFTLGALGATILKPGESTTFTATFSPSNSGTRNAAIHITSNDADENPFTVALTGTGFSLTTDTDGDGMNDGAEILLQDLGFDWEVPQTDLVNTYYAYANQAGLYSTSQVQALHAPMPVISCDAVTGKVTLTMDWQISPDLQDYADLPANSERVSVWVNGEGDIELEYDPEDEDAAFFRVGVR